MQLAIAIFLLAIGSMMIYMSVSGKADFSSIWSVYTSAFKDLTGKTG